MRRPPEFEQIVLERGDEWAAHVGGAGGFQMTGIQARPPVLAALQQPSMAGSTSTASHGDPTAPSDRESRPMFMPV